MLLSTLRTYQPQLLWALKLSMALFCLGHFSPVDEKIVSQIFYIGIILPVLLLVTVDDIHAVWHSPITKALLAYLLYTSTAWLVVGESNYLRYSIYVLFFTMAVWLLLRYEQVDMDKAAIYFFIAIVLYIVAGFLYLYLSSGALPGRPFFSGWMTENPIHICSILATATAVCVVLFYQQQKILYALLTLMLSTMLMYIFETRTGYLALLFFAAVFIGVAFIAGNKQHKQRLGLFVVISIAVLGLLYFSGYLDPLLQRGNSYRFIIWNILMEKLKDCSYLLGCGYDHNIHEYYFTKTTKIVHAHSIYVSELFYSGILGIILLFLFLGHTLYYGIKHKLIWVYGFAAACAALSVDGSFALRPPRNEIWMIFWLPAIIVNMQLAKHLFDQKSHRAIK